MLREEYLRRLVDNSYLNIYLSANDGARFYWPWRMQPVHEANKTYRNACEKYIIDSSFNDESITNEDVLDISAKLGAETAVLADVYQDKEATVEAIKDGLDTVDDHHFDGNIMAPLQAPHDSCLGALDDKAIDMVAIGGLKDATCSEQIQAANSIRQMSTNIHIHGLGWGLSKQDGKPNELVTTLHDNPNLIDSVDYSTPVQQAMKVNHEIDKGEETSSFQAAEAATTLIRDLRRVSKYADVDTGTKQVTL